MHDGQQHEMQAEIARPLTPPEEQRLAKAELLAELAIARQASLSEEGFRVYLRSLAKCDVQDLRAAVEWLSIEPRRDYKSAFPELGELLARIRNAEDKRSAAARQEAQRRRRERGVEEAIIQCAVEAHEEGRWKGFDSLFRGNESWDSPRLRAEIDAAIEECDEGKSLCSFSALDHFNSQQKRGEHKS
jgi:hypothetical protein